MRTAIYGAGSLGTILGAYITKNGGFIDLINRNKAHVEALRTNGYINIIIGNEHSKFSLCSFSGNVDIFKFYFEEGEG